jgi:hypothetical protein
MTLTIPDDIAEFVSGVARKSGGTPDSLLLDALRAHFPPIPDDLKDEFDALERASDADLLFFESSLEAR